MKPAVVILAAGASERLGECKALVDLGGQSALLRLIGAARLAQDGEICVVSGAHHARIAAALEREPPGPRVRLVYNEGWHTGRSGSLALAAAALPDRALLVAPVDVPLVSHPVFESLLRAWAQAGDPPRGWLAPYIELGRRYGHPLILGRELAREISTCAPDAPLRDLRARADSLWGVSVLDPAILDDLDTQADLARLRRRLSSGQES